jgi:phosphatidylserine/phosphatidylglycerophosphate/cardiolipin synthase-like enzyme
MTLQWTPLFESIIQVGGKCNLLIAPFIQTDALIALLQHFDNSKLQVITSWTASSLATGVSDPRVYKVLKEMQVPLYIHPNIHLKLFVFDDNVGFHTSANITRKGLGLVPNSNIEVGVHLPLELNDWLRINDLLETSHRVTDQVYTKAQRYVDENKNTSPPLPPFELPIICEVHPFSRQALPQSPTPDDLWAFYRNGSAGTTPRAAYFHDLWLYGITKGNLSREDFQKRLGEAFRSHPFVEAIVTLLKDRGTLHFGAVNAWITNSCSDRPTPSRWEIKPATQRLYEWLTCFFDEVSWSRPNVSQIITWTDFNVKRS